MSSEKINQNYLSILPSEVLTQILFRVDFPTVYSAMPSVSKYFNNITLADLWNRNENYYNVHFFKSINSANPAYARQKIKDAFTEIYNKIINLINEYLPELKDDPIKNEIVHCWMEIIISVMENDSGRFEHYCNAICESKFIEPSLKQYLMLKIVDGIDGHGKTVIDHAVYMNNQAILNTTYRCMTTLFMETQFVPKTLTIYEKSSDQFPNHQGFRSSKSIAINDEFKRDYELLKFHWTIICRQSLDILKSLDRTDEDDSCGTSPSGYAICAGNLDTIKYLTNTGLMPKSWDYKDEIIDSGIFKFKTYAIHSIHFAAELGHLDIVRFYVEEKNVSVNISIENGPTPLYIAIRHGKLEVVKYLYAHGANINTMHYDFYPNLICFALQQANIDTIDWISEIYQFTEKELKYILRRPQTYKLMMKKNLLPLWFTPEFPASFHGLEYFFLKINHISRKSPLIKTVTFLGFTQDVVDWNNTKKNNAFFPAMLYAKSLLEEKFIHLDPYKFGLKNEAGGLMDELINSMKNNHTKTLPELIQQLKNTSNNFRILKSQNLLSFQEFFKEIQDFFDHLENGWKALEAYQSQFQPAQLSANNSNNNSQSTNVPVYTAGNIHAIYQPSAAASDYQLMDVDCEFESDKFGPDFW